MGIEPTRPAWKAGVLPLNYTRKIKMVGKTGFEPATPWSQAKYSTKLSYFPTINHTSLFGEKWRALRDSNSRPFDS